MNPDKNEKFILRPLMILDFRFSTQEIKSYRNKNDNMVKTLISVQPKSLVVVQTLSSREDPRQKKKKR